MGIPPSACFGLGARVSTGGMTFSAPLPITGGALDGLCFVGEKPGLLGLRLWRAGPLMGLDDGSTGRGRGDRCFIGETPPASGWSWKVGGGLAAGSAGTGIRGAGRGEVCLIGDRPGDGGASRWRLGPVVGLEDGRWLTAVVGSED